MDQKLPPYQRLKSILNEGSENLTTKANKNLEQLLGITKKETLMDKVLSFFKKIDQKIFNSTTQWNSYKRRRK